MTDSGHRAGEYSGASGGAGGAIKMGRGGRFWVQHHGRSVSASATSPAPSGWQLEVPMCNTYLQLWIVSLYAISVLQILFCPSNPTAP